MANRKLNTSIYASAARTATPTAVSYSPTGQHVDVILDLTAFTTAASLTVTIDAYDDTSTKYYNLLTGAAVTATGTTVYRVGLGLTEAANLTANYVLPNSIRVTVTHGNANSHTYSVSINDYY